MSAVDNLFAGGARMVSEEAIELTLQLLRAYWDRHEHVAIAWSGGKDSTATLTLLIHLIEAGELPRPAKLFVFYADTRQELPPIQLAAEQVIALLRLRDWIEVVVVRAPLDKRFMVYILGRGVPPPNNNTLRWCTRQIKVDPMAEALGAGRIEMYCSKDGAECGQGWYQQALPEAKGVRGRIATLAPILHWRVCIVWDWLKVYAPQPEFGGWPVRILADAYGGDDTEEINARTGCIACPLAVKDTALDYLVGTDAWAHLAPLKELKPLYRWMREPAQRDLSVDCRRHGGAVGRIAARSARRAIRGGSMTRRPCHHNADCPGTGLDCGPDQERHYVKRAAPKTAAELTEIRTRAWATRRAKYGECGHHGSYLR